MALTCASVPSSTTTVLPWPWIPLASRPPATLSSTSRRPCATDSVTRTPKPPASTSARARPVSASIPPSSRLSTPGTVLTGASLTARTPRATLPLLVRAPPLPDAPPSSAVTLRVSVPWKSAVGLYCRPPTWASVACSAAAFACTVTVAVPLPLTEAAATPPGTSVASCSVPWATVRVSVSGASPASTSATRSPAKLRTVSSSIHWADGSVSAGASLTARMVMSTVSVVTRAPPAPLCLPSSLCIVSVSLP